MFILSFLRAIKFSLQDLVRNVWLSLVTVIILILALFSINLLLVVKVISSAAIEAVKQKIDISLYLKNDSQESQIMALKGKISNLSQVEEVDYISKQAALDDFRNKHKNDPQILTALIELGRNPLTPSLIIKPKNPDQYDELIANLNKMQDDNIESRNFDDHRAILARINEITAKISQAGLAISLIFVVITLLVVYNAIRVAIYTHRREIAIMKLVGASNWFIRAPYLISSIIYTLLGMLAVISLFYVFLGLAQPYFQAFFSGYNFDIISYFNNNFLTIFGLEFLAAVFINMLASLVAVGKYSKV